MCSGLFIRKHFQWCSENSPALHYSWSQRRGFYHHSDVFKCVLSCSVMSSSLQMYEWNDPKWAHRGCQRTGESGREHPPTLQDNHVPHVSELHGGPLTPDSSSDDSDRALLATQCRLEKVLALGDISLLQSLAFCPLLPPPGPLCLLLSLSPSPFRASWAGHNLHHSFS